MLVEFRAIDRYQNQLCAFFGNSDSCKLLEEEKETCAVRGFDMLSCRSCMNVFV